MEEGDFFNCCFSEINSGMTTKKSNNQKRFSEEQIKSLEVMFETETRLDPRKKEKLAKALGLQPRQVAIWFQNKRARWKSKQLEKDYNILKANYNNLASQFESMKKEKQALVSQLQRINEEMQKSKEKRHHEHIEQGVALSSNVETDYEKCEPEVWLNQEIVLCNDEVKTEYFGFEEETNHELMNIVEKADDSCLTSSENWGGGFNSDSFLDQSSSDYPWWDFWS